MMKCSVPTAEACRCWASILESSRIFFVRAVKGISLRGLRPGVLSVADTPIVIAALGNDAPTKEQADALVEFRQPYFGPVTQRYGNLFRANDCPGDTLRNRVATTDTRLVVGSAAVHSDMLKWTPSTDRFDAARSILPVLFTTVQYSMDLKTIPAEQKAELAKWVRFAREHRAALQEGGFRAYSPEANYPLLEGWSDTERIFAVYDPKTAVPAPAGDSRRLIVVNATPARRVLVETASGVKSVAVEPYDFGEVE